MENLNNYILNNFLKNKKNIAIRNGIDKSSEISYEKLLENCFKVYEQLKYIGLKKGDKLLIPGTKIIETYSIVFASIFLGVTYCIYDLRSPANRLEKIINLFDPDLVLFTSKNNELINNKCKSRKLILFEDFLKTSNYQSEKYSDFLNEVMKFEDNDFDAYIMFTSGSTGFPKGAIITRNNLKNFISWIEKDFFSEKQKVVSNINPLYFDNSVFDIFSSIPFGHILQFYDLDNKNAYKSLEDDLYNSLIDQWFSVPSLLIKIKNLTRHRRFSGDKNVLIIFGGEGFSSNLLKEMMIKFNSFSFINVYGPTECTCIATKKEIKSINFNEYKGLPTLGNVLSNFTFEIINKDNEGIGELILKGDFVGRGYINNKEESFKSFYKKKNKKCYLTGDLVKEINNELYHCGRKDNQIKRMGYRIELEEIEYTISSFESIDDVAAIFNKVSERSYLFLVIKTNKFIEKRFLLREIKTALPFYMFPDDILIAEEIKRNRNGKIDRKSIKKNLDNYSSLLTDK